MSTPSGDVGAFSAKVWGGWAMGLIAGFIFLMLGVVGLAGTPDLFVGSGGVNPLWTPLMLGLVALGSLLILVSTVVADRRYRSIRSMAEDRRERRQRKRRTVVMGTYELDFGDVDADGGVRWSVVLLLALLATLLVAAWAVANGVVTPPPVDLPTSG